MAFDSATTAQGDDHGRLLVSTADGSGGGSIVTIDAGSNAFAWRLSGVIFGSVLVGLVYLLAATMFSRRRIAVLAAAFVALDPMSYVMSRISMNDIFVATFIVAAYLVFWQVWSGRWARSAWWALPLVGVLIGLAAASKWVGFYALGRPARARAGSVRARAAAARGARGVRARPRRASAARGRSCVVMLALLALALAITWVRPIRLDIGESIGALAATAMVVTGVGLAFVLAYALGRGSGAGKRRRVRVRPARSRCRGGVAGLDHDRRGRRAHRLAGVSVAARPAFGRALVPARRDERVRLVMGRRVPGDRAAGRLRADLHPVPAARPRLGDRRRAGIQLVGRRAPRPDVRLPLQPDRRPRQRLAVVELAAGAEADLVPRQQLRRSTRSR